MKGTVLHYFIVVDLLGPGRLDVVNDVERIQVRERKVVIHEIKIHEERTKLDKLLHHLHKMKTNHRTKQVPIDLLVTPNITVNGKVTYQVRLASTVSLLRVLIVHLTVFM